MSKRFVNVFAEQQRILILQLLESDVDGSINNLLLQRGLEEFGHNISLDKVNTECAWLEEQGCVEIRPLNEEMNLVTITDVGIDVVNRRRRIPGIDLPVKGI
ncbi:MAG: hypothetical protein J5800_05415 [Spirochaetales bacterium]|nr:hypothetical protein [Spirochaetales bacterium]MBR4426844.1 hypothetical protein [Spirochaetales bacterium]